MKNKLENINSINLSHQQSIVSKIFSPINEKVFEKNFKIILYNREIQILYEFSKAEIKNDFLDFKKFLKVKKFFSEVEFKTIDFLLIDYENEINILDSQTFYDYYNHDSDLKIIAYNKVNIEDKSISQSILIGNNINRQSINNNESILVETSILASSFSINKYFSSNNIIKDGFFNIDNLSKNQVNQLNEINVYREDNGITEKNEHPFRNNYEDDDNQNKIPSRTSYLNKEEIKESKNLLHNSLSLKDHINADYNSYKKKQNTDEISEENTRLESKCKNPIKRDIDNDNNNSSSSSSNASNENKSLVLNNINNKNTDKNRNLNQNELKSLYSSSSQNLEHEYNHLKSPINNLILNKSYLVQDNLLKSKLSPKLNKNEYEVSHENSLQIINSEINSQFNKLSAKLIELENINTCLKNEASTRESDLQSIILQKINEISLLQQTNIQLISAIKDKFSIISILENKLKENKDKITTLTFLLSEINVKNEYLYNKLDKNRQIYKDEINGIINNIEYKNANFDSKIVVKNNHDNQVCKICKKNLINANFYYRCSKCEDIKFIICEKCKNSRIHIHKQNHYIDMPLDNFKKNDMKIKDFFQPCDENMNKARDFNNNIIQKSHYPYFSHEDTFQKIIKNLSENKIILSSYFGEKYYYEMIEGKKIFYLKVENFSEEAFSEIVNFHVYINKNQTPRSKNIEENYYIDYKPKIKKLFIPPKKFIVVKIHFGIIDNNSSESNNDKIIHLNIDMFFNEENSKNHKMNVCEINNLENFELIFTKDFAQKKIAEYFKIKEFDNNYFEEKSILLIKLEKKINDWNKLSDTEKRISDDYDKFYEFVEV